MGNDTGAEPDVAIELLGGFRVEVDGHVVHRADWPTRRARELVQLLVLAETHSLSRDQAMTGLWPDLDRDAAGANLRKAAHHARKALGDDEAVVLGRGRVRLFPGADVLVDLEVFEAAARDALADDDSDACAQALEHWGGTLLPGARYASWAEARRTHVQRLHHRLLAGAGRLERLLELEPTDEAATRRLMLQRLEVEDRHGAIRAFSRLRSHLARELGVAPGPEVTAVYDHCVAGLRPLEPMVVGRDEELATGVAALAGARRGEVGMLVVHGRAGIGKSALLHALADRAGSDGWLAPRVVATADAAPHAVLASLVDQLLGGDPSLVEALTDTARSVLATVSEMAGPAPPPPDGIDRERVTGAVRQLLAAMPDPVALLVDDADRADRATTDVLVRLAAGDTGGALLVVLAARRADEEGLPGVDLLLRGRRGVALELGAIPDEHLGTVVRLAGPDELDPDVVDEVVARSEGNPFVAEELVDGLDDGEVAATAWEAVATRLVDLDDEATSLLERLAVAGAPLGLDDVVAITGLDATAAGDLLDRAIDAGVLAIDAASYRFRHDLVAEALVERMPPHRRAVAHRCVARGLGEVDAAPARVAQHWLAAGEEQTATPWLLAAVEDAHDVGALHDADDHLQRLLEIAPEHARGLWLHARVLDAFGDFEAPVAYGRAANVADPEEVAEIRAEQARSQLKRGDPEGALETLDGVEVASLEGEVAVAATRCGAAMLGVGDPDEAAALAEEARRRAMRVGDGAAVMEASWAGSLVAHGRHDMSGLLEADLAAIEDTPEFTTEVFDGLLCATEGLVHGDLTENRRDSFATSLAEQARDLGAVRAEAFAITVRGASRSLAGDLAAAEDDLTAGARLHEQIGAPGGRSLALQHLAEVTLAGGDRERASSLSDASLAAARECALGHHLLDRIHGTMVRIASGADEVADAIARGEASLVTDRETCPACRVTFAVPAAIGAAQLGDLDRAQRHARTAAGSTEWFWPGTAWVAAVDEVRAHLAAADGEPDAARRHLAQAEQGFAALGHHRDAQRCAGLAGSLTE